MGCPTFLIHSSTSFLKAFPISPVVPAVVPVCKCVTHSLPFNWLSVYSFFSPWLYCTWFFPFSPLSAETPAIRYWTILFKQIKVQYNTSFRYHFPSSVQEQYLHGLRCVLQQLWDFPAGATLQLVASFCSPRSSCSSCSSRSDNAFDVLSAPPSCPFVLKILSQPFREQAFAGFSEEKSTFRVDLSFFFLKVIMVIP